MGRHVISAIAIIFSIAATSARADLLLDQQNDVSPSATADSTSGGFQEIGQTFTVGVTGTLSSIAVQINFPGFGSSGNAILNVYHTSDGLPTGGSLGMAQLPSIVVPSTGYAFMQFNVFLSDISVHAGDVLAFGISSSQDSYFVVRNSFDHSTYARGQSVYRTLSPTGAWTPFPISHDEGFETFVSTPPALPGDFNLNGVVDAADYVLWRDHLGDSTETALNGNGDGENGVDDGDYALWREQFGFNGTPAPAAASAVPEPMTCVLFLAAVCCLNAGIRRR